jgi:hypothetical protein
LAIILATIGRNAACDAIVDLLDVSGPGNLQVGTSGFASILATITLSATAFGSASTGAATLAGTPLQDAAADNSGTAAVWRMRTSGGTAILSGTTATTDDGGDITLDVSARNAALDAIDALIGTGGDLQITTAGDTNFVSPLITLSLGNPAFGAASSGSMTITGSPSGNATAAGTAALFRIRNTADAEVFRGTVGTSGSDINFNNTTFGVGSTITITGFQYQMAATSAGSSAVLVFAGGLAFTAGETVEVSSFTFTQPA